ncbi:hypothetical protein DH2020_036603 [Rehmannia glutinosa]|uniref:Uncharacterized protein n=1 Tax=Rehmannia glutinosa TaxID=99300 RepID=A0ABR0V450_REHGL
MAGYEGTSLNSKARSGKMIYEPILEEEYSALIVLQMIEMLHFQAFLLKTRNDISLLEQIDLRKESNIKLISSSAYPVITFGPFASPTDVLVSFARAVGTVFMPPKWSLGYQQCRWSYDSAARVREIARIFREKGIPCDVIWMDIDYMDGFRCLTFDQERFPDPKSLVDDLHQNGFKAIWMLNPGIKKKRDILSMTVVQKDIWILTADGKPFVGDVWPGPCVFPDFTQSSARSWWANLVKDFIANGVDGIWNDMNEPAVFKVYGMLMARSTYEGMKLANGQKRPFVLARAGFVGSQRYAATWTGDNISTWEHLHMSISMVVQLVSVADTVQYLSSEFSFFLMITGLPDALCVFYMRIFDCHTIYFRRILPDALVRGLSGQPFSGPDIGGFAGNATPKLFGRWMGLGAMFPFAVDILRLTLLIMNPGLSGEECEEVCRLALRRRYRLLSHLYTLFYMAHTRGIPVATPHFCWYDLIINKIGDDIDVTPHSPNIWLVKKFQFSSDPKDLELRTHENSFLLGPLLVYGSTGRDQELYQMQHKLPKGIWFSFDFEDTHPDLPALYLQGGSIIPVAPPYQHVGEANETDDLSLLVALDRHGKAEGFLFEDDGDGYEYTRGNYLLTTYIAEQQSSMVTVKVSKTEGSWKRPNRRLHVQLLLGKGAMIDAWGTDGEILQIPMPSESEVSDLVLASEKKFRIRLESAKRIPDVDNVSGHKGTELSRTPVELKSGDWALKVVPWIGGRVISMEHLPSVEVDVNGYEEYSGMEDRSAGCSEEYSVVERDLEPAGEVESLQLEGDIEVV